MFYGHHNECYLELRCIKNTIIKCTTIYYFVTVDYDDKTWPPLTDAMDIDLNFYDVN